MKRIILSCAVVASALAFAVNNNAGAAPKNMEGFKYEANDTIPKKDTVKKDTTNGLYASAFNYSVNDTIPKKDTVKKDTTHAMAFVK